MLFKKIFQIFTKEIIKPFSVPEYIIFNVSNFNNWFRDVNNNAVYANQGIYLRLDKLSESHIVDYIEKCYGIKAGERDWSIKIIEFHEKIRNDWKKSSKYAS